MCERRSIQPGRTKRFSFSQLTILGKVELLGVLISLKLWLEKYAEIAEIMGYDPERDRRATEIAARILKAYRIEPPLSRLRELLFRKPVMIFGAGPSLDEKVDALARVFPGLSDEFTLIAADGATQAIVERGRVPHIIVTDLDGDLKTILDSARRGSIIAVHAHGDNIEKISRHMEEMISATRLIIGTTQVEPVSPLVNFGGFTDGDRAVFMASSYEAAPIVLIGMDFGKIVGRRSKPWLRRDVDAWGDKLKKLKIAHDLISWISTRLDLEIYTTSEIAPPGTRRLRLEEIKRILRCHD
jgi:hypothetical protein